MKIAFIGKGNAVRSIMAEAVARKVFADLGIKAEMFSAGVEPEQEVNPTTLQVLEERGYNIEALKPKSLKSIPYRKVDVLIILCNEAKEACEFVLNHKRRENWLIDEPSGSVESFKKTLEDIEEHIKELLKL